MSSSTWMNITSPPVDEPPVHQYISHRLLHARPIRYVTRFCVQFMCILARLCACVCGYSDLYSTNIPPPCVTTQKPTSATTQQTASVVTTTTVTITAAPITTVTATITAVPIVTVTATASPIGTTTAATVFAARTATVTATPIATATPNVTAAPIATVTTATIIAASTATVTATPIATATPNVTAARIATVTAATVIAAHTATVTAASTATTISANPEPVVRNFHDISMCSELVYVQLQRAPVNYSLRLSAGWRKSKDLSHSEQEWIGRTLFSGKGFLPYVIKSVFFFREGNISFKLEAVVASTRAIPINQVTRP